MNIMAIKITDLETELNEAGMSAIHGGFGNNLGGYQADDGIIGPTVPLGVMNDMPIAQADSGIVITDTSAGIYSQTQCP
jgi:hypothetical protein